MRMRARTMVFLVLLSAPLLLYLLLPVGGLFARTTLREFGAYVCCPKVASALHLSLTTSLLATLGAVVLGTPLAYLLAHHRFRGREALDTLVDLPMVLPPAAAGLCLLLVFGRQGLGAWLEPYGIRLSFTVMAVVMAQLFVASPYFVKQARAGFESVGSQLKAASLTLGASPLRTFWRVTVPLSSRSLIAGAAMTWARALGEFGATLMFAGAFEGRTETMPIAIYTASTTNLPASIVLAAALVGASFLVLLIAKLLLEKGVTSSP